LHWDFLRLFHEMKKGIHAFKHGEWITAW
jgi:hypothetical protein